MRTCTLSSFSKYLLHLSDPKKFKVDHATVSHGWWDRFRQRHPNLTLPRAGETLAYIVCLQVVGLTLNSLVIGSVTTSLSMLVDP